MHNPESAPTFKPILTAYKGYRFRSRLEARWAVAFDAMNFEWTYEPEGFDLGDGILYLPDFLLNYTEEYHTKRKARGAWVEIKPDTPTADEMKKCALLAEHTHKFVHLLAGNIGDQQIFRGTLRGS